MLLRFSVENVLCFAGEAIFSMIASDDTKHSSHVLKGESPTQPSILRASALYGANAHGKTSFVSAIDMLRDLVVQNNENNRIKANKLFRTLASQPSRFIIEFRLAEEDCEYGLVVSKTHIHEEWLFTKSSSGVERKIFERVTSIADQKTFTTKVRFGDALRKGKYKNTKHSFATVLDVIAESIPPNRTLLHEGFSRDIDVLKGAFEWFRSILTPVSATSTYRPLFERAKSDRKFMKHLSNFMRRADVGIDSVRFRETSADEASLPDELRDEAEELEAEEMLIAGGDEGLELAIYRTRKGEIVTAKLITFRKSDGDEPIAFDIDEESAGTRRLFDLLPMTMSDHGRARVYVVDELDRKLHPLLTRALIETFFEKGSGQLIFTTHNTFLMDLSLLRADEIWFVQKRKDGSSELYSLSDLKIDNSIDIRQGYLNGRFGAIPFLGDIEKLGWKRNS